MRCRAPAGPVRSRDEVLGRRCPPRPPRIAAGSVRHRRSPGVRFVVGDRGKRRPERPADRARGRQGRSYPMNALNEMTADRAEAPKKTVRRFDEVEAALTEATDRAALFADPRFVKRLTGRLDDLLHGRTVLSLDVFDTLL